MTYTQAKLVANSPDGYTADQMHKAAVVLLGSLQATDEDIQDATDLQIQAARLRRSSAA